ncbi:hypothetical protein BDA96_03G174500 [Sorghum bicolor]|uniref:Uncharacterized protein n=1 Tax=Sorghum bicolor TaxID=4558 RepID=A0A921UN31_SORBI|nr:hypothetical protein BDA96_03G174500 [Sorghum bicolor]
MRRTRQRRRPRRRRPASSSSSVPPPSPACQLCFSLSSPPSLSPSLSRRRRVPGDGAFAGGTPA